MTVERLPVVIVGTNCLSGVTTWADQLRGALTDHPRYDPRLLYIGVENPAGFDIHAPTVVEAMQVVREIAPVILLPNYMWEMFQLGLETDILCVGICHADDDEQYYRPLSWYEPFVSKFIAVSRECAERLTHRLPFRAQDISTLPYGICVPPELRRDYQVDSLRVVYAGRVIQRQKRVWDFVPLVDRLTKAGVSFAFDIIGEGDDFAALKDEMQDRFPSGRVRCYPRIPHREMPRVWREHDVFVQVSDFEGTSVSMLEAMAFGVVPVVTAASSGIDGIIHTGKNGFVVPVGDMTTLADALTRLAADRALLASAGRAAHATAQEYSMDLYIERFCRFLDQVVATGNQIDVHERYGIFGGLHPLFMQRQRILSQEQQINELQRGTMQRIIDGGYQQLLPAKIRRLLKNRSGRRAAG